MAMAGDMTLSSHTTDLVQNPTAYALNGTILDSQVGDIVTVSSFCICTYLELFLPAACILTSRHWTCKDVLEQFKYLGWDGF